MKNFPNLAGFEGLLDLDRRGVDIRPTLLRVLTDQYLQSPVHSPDEERHYTELALRLLDETDLATRATISSRLAPYACTPLPIVQQLARDLLDVAEPVLLYSPRLTPADFEAIVAERGPAYAVVIAKRGKPAEPAQDAAPLKARSKAPDVASAMASVSPRDVSRIALQPANPEPLAGTEQSIAEQASELCEIFFSAGAAERQFILMSLEYIGDSPQMQLGAMQRPDIWHLELAALQHNTEAVVRDLERALGISRAQARRIVNDDLGDPIVVAAKAMQLPADVLQRMLLFMNPRVGQSVDRVYELAALFHEISTDAARRLVAIWRHADPPNMQPARHEAQWQDAAGRARQALGEIARRLPASRELRADERATGTYRH